jgi:hypothetical protein
MTRFAVLLALAAAAASASAVALPAAAEGYCKAGDNFDEAKGLCYAPAAAYKPAVPHNGPAGGTPTGGWLPSLGGFGKNGILGAVADKAVFCNYGDRLVGSGDQAYCVAKATGKPYPAGR